MIMLCQCSGIKTTELENEARVSPAGKPSYEARGISIEEYTRYWDECVIDRFVKFGTERPADTIDLPCMMPTAEQVERLAAELPLPLPLP
jgi:hypothetical protein